MAESESELTLVCSSDIICCDSGDEAVLSCHLEPQISAVSMEIRWYFRVDQICHYKDGQMNLSRDYEGRVSFSLEELRNGNVSLTLRDVRRSQCGLYICEVIHKCRSVKEYIFLHIRSEDFALVTHTGTVYSYVGEDVTLPAHLSPETSAASMKINWFRETELIYQYRNRRQVILNNHFERRVNLSIQELERGIISLNLRNVQPSDSGHYICCVSRDVDLKIGVVHLQVRDLQSVDKLEQMQHVLRKIQHNLLRQKTEETLQLLEEALENNGKELKRKTKSVLAELEDDWTTETQLMEGPMARRSNSTEAIRPLMESESSDQNTRQTTAGSTVTEQEPPSSAVPSLLQQRESQSANPIMQRVEETRQTTAGSTVTEQEPPSSAVPSLLQQRESQSANPIMQRVEETRQESVSIQHTRSSPATQSTHEQETTSPSTQRNPSQPPRRRENREQRRREQNCQIS